ncbi:MAG: hypothetical protein IPN01_20375 [Deltaproteobacteria bacterium]|nr:hypothetical protein [Deltaproteobacteria bacterium]
MLWSLWRFIMGARLSPVLWLCLAFAVPAIAAAPIDPDVAAASARGNPKAIAKLVKSLNSADAAERDAAEEALLILGVEAIPSLRAAIVAKEPSAEAALGVLGALGHAGSVTYIQSLVSDPRLGGAAKIALVKANEAHWQKVSESPTLALCDEHLKLFPESPHAEEARRERAEQAAWSALVALGASPPQKELEALIAAHPGTRADAKAKKMIAEALFDKADRAISDGRPWDALALLEEGRGWDPTFSTARMEARANKALGRTAAAKSDWDKAIPALESAWKASPSNTTTRDLSDAYVARGMERLNKGDAAGGFDDLNRALAVDPTLADKVANERADRMPALVNEVKTGSKGKVAAAVALVVIGPEGVKALIPVAMERAAMGDAQPLSEAAKVALGGDPATKAALSAALSQSFTAADRAVQTQILPNSAALVRPEDPWSPAAMRARETALKDLTAWLGLLTASQLYAQQGDPAHRPPTDSPPPDAELVGYLAKGARPDQASLPLVARVALTRYVLDGAALAIDMVRSDPAKLGAQLVGRGRPPADLAQWREVVDVARSGPTMAKWSVLLPMGGNIELSHQFVGNTLRFQARGQSLAAGVADANLSELLVMFFALSRLSLSVDPSIDRLELVIGGPGTSVTTVRARLSLSRVKPPVWSNVEIMAPYTRDELALIPELEAELR